MAFRIGGAGISGLTAAITLAHAGESVDVFEVKSRVGSSAGPHTEGIRNYLGQDGLADLGRFGIKVQPFSLVQRVVRRSPHHVSVIRGPSYYLVARGGSPGTLERQLLEEALDAGARVHFRRRVSPAEVDLWAAGPPPKKVNMIAAGYRFEREGSNLSDDEIQALFDNEVAPRGYFCVLPGPVWNSVYGCAWGDVRYAALLGMVECALKLDWVRELLGSSKRVGKIFGKGYFAANPYADVVSGSTLVSGESAGIQDAVGGFGIRYAVASGALAARSLLGENDYGRALREEFKDDFELAMQGRAWLDAATNEDLDAFLEKLGPEGQVPDYSTWRKVRFI